MEKFVHISLLCAVTGIIFCLAVPPVCDDLLMTDVCDAYVKWIQCHLYEARVSCRRSCGICGGGWSAWSGWALCSGSCGGTQTRTRLCTGKPDECKGPDVQHKACVACHGATVPPPIAAVTGAAGLTNVSAGAGVTKAPFPALCNDSRFACKDALDSCIDVKLVCDGYLDCTNGKDEVLTSCVASQDSNDTFQIKNEWKQVCMEVITDDPAGPINGVRAYRRCPSKLNPERNRFLWKWWKSFHLLNIETGRCLESQNPMAVTTPELTTKPCDSTRDNQKFVCDDRGTNDLLIRLRKLTDETDNRYITLGLTNLGWPPELTSNYTHLNNFWHKGPQEPPSTICGDLQVYWSEWSTWGPCSMTCVGGHHSHTRTCINGMEGVSPCVGGNNEVLPCNAAIPCSVPGKHSQNSNCRNSWKTVNNSRALLEKVPIDPGCYKLLDASLMTYAEAKTECARHRGFLASIKDNAGSDILKTLMASASVSAMVYVGIEENFYNAPIQGHHLRYILDHTPIGKFRPWKADCVLGAGFDYAGTVAETSTGITCQRWDINIPHTVNYHPVDGDAHNRCRNPNLDSIGPWCYTTDPDKEKDYCEIPHCLETTTTEKLSVMSEFQFEHECQDVILKVKGVAYLQVTGPVGVKSQIATRTGCVAHKKTRRSTSVPSRRKFVWDSTRNKIMFARDDLCLEAKSTRPESTPLFVTCVANRINQRWLAAKNMLYLNVHEMDVHLDMSIDQKRVVVTTVDLTAWTVTKAGGHFVDWAGLRKVLEDQSFHLYSITDNLCLGVNISDGSDQAASMNPSNVFPILMPCHYSPSLKWVRYRGNLNIFFHMQTSLCLKIPTLKSGTVLEMGTCVSDPAMKLSCQDNLMINSAQNNKLYLTTSGGSVIISELSSETTKWMIWESKSRTPCSVKTPIHYKPIGSQFSIRNKFSKLCLHTGGNGNVFGKTCQPFGSAEDEVWQFGENPTFIMHTATRFCLTLGTYRAGAIIVGRGCSFSNPLQHWAIFPRNSHFFRHPSPKIYYSIHLIEDLNFIFSMNSVYKNVLIRDDTTRYWYARNSLGIATSIENAASCVAASIKSKYFYRGNASHSISGKECNPWSSHGKAIFPELEENFCRNPGNDSKFPWCYVRDASGALQPETCHLPECPTVKVAVDKAGKWHAVSGKDKMHCFCQAEPECYRGIGVDYVGSWNITKGGVCVSWSDHISKGVADHNFCRNPTGSPAGPWCYLTKVNTLKETCPVPKCHKTCPKAPEGLFHAETVHHEFAAAVYGLESGSKAITQCHRGYWVSAGKFRHESTCADARWQPEPASCRVVSCPTITLTVPGATLSSSTNILYGQINSYVCDGQNLAGPGKISIDFQCNEVGQWKKVSGQADECTVACDPGWTSFRTQCYKVNTTKLPYDQAKAGCQAIGATLADLQDETEFGFLKHLVVTTDKAKHGLNTLYWLGIQHVPKRPTPRHPLWRAYRSVNTKSQREINIKKGSAYLPIMRHEFYVMHYMHNRYTKEFDDLLAYDQRCMFIDDKYFFAASRGCYDYKPSQMLWMWVTPFHLYNKASKRCLTGFPKDGFTKQDILPSARANPCDITNKNQFVGCRRQKTHSSLKLLFREGSYFVDDVSEPWDKIQMGGGFYAGNYTRWVLNTSDYDICHHSVLPRGNVFLLWEGKQAEGKSYTFTEADTKCTDHHSRLATKAELDTALTKEDISSCACAWVDGGDAYSVMGSNDPYCTFSAPKGGVKQCTPTPTKADVWCYKGSDNPLTLPWALALWLHAADKEGVQEKNPKDPAKYICRKQSRWFCPPPPDLQHASRLETHFTSYSYLGRSSYECDPGYWFGDGRFVQTITCQSDLEWDPDPYRLICKYLSCPKPTEVLNANLSRIDGLDWQDKAYFTCYAGFWFAKSIFKTKVTCSGNAEWAPSLLTLKCLPVVCDPPEKIPFARIDSFTFEYPYNATITCDDGYWFGPGIPTTDINCAADGSWKPAPKDVVCWEVICSPPGDVKNAAWVPLDKKTNNLSCAAGYELKSWRSDLSANFTHTITLRCGNDGNWNPDSTDFYCEEIKCRSPPDVVGAESNKTQFLDEYTYKREVTYYCHPGRSIRRIFSPYAVLKETCFVEDADGYIHAREEACGTPDALYLQWVENEIEGKTMHLKDVHSGLCLTVESLPTAVATFKKFILTYCNSSDYRQGWFCNEDGVSNLIIGLNASQHFYLAYSESGKYLHTSSDKIDGLEIIAYSERHLETEMDICHFRKPYHKQTVSCIRQGRWIPDPYTIQCETINCTSPPILKNSQVRTISERKDGYVYGTAVKYTCWSGCSAMSTWIPNPVNLICKSIQCSPYKVPENAKVTFGNIENRNYKAHMTIACKIGWNFREALEAITVYCSDEGIWKASHDVNECQIVICPKPPTLANTTMTSTGTQYNSLTRYSCNEGYWIKPGIFYKDVHCSQFGTWSPDPDTLSCKKIECGDPGPVPRTYKYEVARPFREFHFGSIIMYKCPTGQWFAKDVHKIAITCRDDAEWHPHPTTIYCKDMTCSKPENLPLNSFLIGDDFSFERSVTIVCDRGHRLGSNSLTATNQTKITCTKQQTWIPDMRQFQCLPISCGKPTNVSFTSMVESDHLFGSFTQYFCDLGYWIQPALHSRISECNADGRWYPDPRNFICKEVDCGHPGTFYNAKPVKPPSGTKYGASATIECSDGYLLKDQHKSMITITCSKEGLWEPPPENIFCVESRCPDPGSVKNAERTVVSDRPIAEVAFENPDTGTWEFNFGVQLKLVCNHGLEFSRQTSTAVTTCAGDGTWSLNPQDLKCNEIVCPPPNAIMHGFVSKNIATSSIQYLVDSTVTYQCDEGFWFNTSVFNMEVTCQKNGKWNVDLTNLGCIRVVCKDPPPIVNGHYVLSGLTFTHTARYFCHDGYTISTASTLTCDGTGKWFPPNTTLKCEATDCGAFPTLENTVVVSSNISTLFTSNVTYKCLTNFYFSPGVDTAILTCAKDGQWHNSRIKCLNVADFECDFPLRGPNTYFTRNSSRKVDMHCTPGYGIKLPGGNVSSTQQLSCNGSSAWIPTNFKCEEIKCPYPSIDGPHVVVGEPVKTKSFSVSTIVDVRCNNGYAMSYKGLNKPKSWFVTKQLLCGELGQWLPSETSLQCKEVDCGNPPELDNTERIFNLTNLTSVAEYHCKHNMTFENLTVFQITCTEDGTWQLNPNQQMCSYAKCNLPAVPKFATLTITALDYKLNDTVALMQEIRISCVSGFSIAPFQFSSKHICNETGHWNPDPTTITCQRVKCYGQPNVTFKLDAYDYIASEYNYGHQLTYLCPKGKWFSPHNVSKQTAECSWDGTWKPSIDKLSCIDVLCDYPPPIPNALLRGSGLVVGSLWLYQCLDEYRMAPGVTSRNIKCLESGDWFPEPNSPLLKCQVVHCSAPPILPHTINDTLSAIEAGHVIKEFKEGHKFTYSCDPGYWISDGVDKVTSKNTTCDFGDWIPSPTESIHCVMVVCDKVMPVEGARTDGIFNAFGSKVNYTCARGQHFAHQKLRRIEVTCEDDGRWNPDPKSLYCSDVYCDNVDLENAYKVVDSFTMGSRSLYSCPPNMWFGHNMTKILAICGENGRWEPSLEGKKCQVVDCGKPDLDHILLAHEDFSYTSQVVLACIGGYILTPEPSSPPTVMCDMTGFWYPTPSLYTCKAVECPIPRFIPRASINGSGLYNTTLVVTCEPGFYLRRGVNQMEIACLHDSTWSEDVHAIECFPFHCPAARQIPNCQLVVSPTVPEYNSFIDYKCNYGFWIRDQVFTQRVFCDEKGLWNPVVDFECKIVKCAHPSKKPNSVFSADSGINLTHYDVDQKMTFKCDDFYWLSVQYNVTEWAFSGLTSVGLRCNVSGLWHPHPDSFACGSLEDGPLPIGQGRGLSAEGVKAAGWLKNEELLWEGFRKHTYLQATPTGQRKLINGRTLPESIIRTGSPSAPGSSVDFAWDGDEQTSWRVNKTEKRIYSMSLYLGDHYRVDGMEIYTGTGNKDEILEMVVDFSADGKRFDKTVGLSFMEVASRSGVMTNPGVQMESIRVAQGQKWKISGFSEFAKFAHIAILSTRHIDYPPVVHDFQLLAQPVKWEIIYPPDYQSVPIFLGTLLLLFVAWACYAFVKDSKDKQTIMFGLNETFMDKLTTQEDFFMIKFRGKELGRVKQIVCRCVGVESKSPIFVMSIDLKNSRIKAENAILIVPPSGKGFTKLCLGCITQNDEDFDQSVKMMVKAGPFEATDPVTGRLTWSFAKTVNFEPNKVNYISVADSDFITKTSRLDGVMITSFGCFSALSVSTVLSSQHDILSALHFYGIGCISSLLVLPLLLALSRYLASQAFRFHTTQDLGEELDKGEDKSSLQVPESGDFASDFDNLAEKPSLASFDRGDVGAMTVSTKKGREFQKLADSILHSSDRRLQELIDELRELYDVDDQESRMFIAEPIPSVTDTQDSCLLPARYRVPRLWNYETISLRDLRIAHKKRLRKLPRRTRSSPAIMQFARLPRFTDTWSSSSLPDIHDVRSRFSCASLWSRDDLIEAWHRVHTSVSRPIGELFGDYNYRSPFFWHDPTYRRIPSNIEFHRADRRSLPEWGQKAVEITSAAPPAEVDDSTTTPSIMTTSESSLRLFDRVDRDTHTTTGSDTSSEVDLKQIPSFFGRLKMRHFRFSQTPDVSEASSSSRFQTTVESTTDATEETSEYEDQTQISFCPMPSSGQKLTSRSRHSDEESLTATEIDTTAEVIKSRVSFHSSVPPIERAPSLHKIPGSEEILVATPAAVLYTVPIARKLFVAAVWLGTLLCMAVSALFGLTTVDKSMDVVLSCAVTAGVYTTLVLVLECVIRAFIFHQGNFLSLAAAFLQNEDNRSSEGSNSGEEFQASEIEIPTFE